MVESYETTTTRIASLSPAVCTLVQDLLPLYLEGEVSPSSRDLIVDHLGHCERCAGYLAGAQSVRGQLRRDLAQRAEAAVAAAPERRALSRGRRLLIGLMSLVLCTVGGFASIGLGAGISGDAPGAAAIGLVFGIGALVMLFLLASVAGPLRSARLGQICAGLGIGVLSGFILSNGPSGPAAFAVPMAFLAMLVVSGAVIASERRPARA
ncbi:MAG: zf-HC2 domain-containing protein [Oscillochloris sp.]|nr:zf-HC2 domain-containing protein [Oscillochloris sp.]